MSSTAPSDHCRGIVDFRDTVVRHILDNDTKLPLTSREIDERLERVIAGNPEDFRRGINNTTAYIFPHTGVTITEHVRDRLRQEYDLRDEEIV
jgi:Glu-tRNA(Gln) amidotransferase subunit E-like FAD-binding protein